MKPLEIRKFPDQVMRKTKMNTIIDVMGLTKRYNDFTAVDHISFKVEKGEVFGFLGPNGAGKTTTIRILTGLSQPTEGNAFILGFAVDSQIVQIKKRIGVVPEISNLYDELTAYDNLLFMAQLYGFRKESGDKERKSC